jgi:hypothetical protein
MSRSFKENGAWKMVPEGLNNDDISLCSKNNLS